ncbi:MAG TPA: ATPase, T2SS/T4P/T4SS family, partial [Labilithrix sp.]|nr:ATPase, T2SS/T4P/T4SS family [Labilithrix sp.]
MPSLDALFDELVKRGGGDLHLAAREPPIARIRGQLQTLGDAPLPAKELEEMLLDLVTPSQRARLAADLDVEFAVAYKDVARFRALYYVKHSGMAAAFRLVPARVPTLAEVAAPEVVRQVAERRSGLIVVAGPSSCGKTTTVAAMIDHVNRTRACHVLTIERAIEFLHEPELAQITQREVGVHVPTVAAALRSASRENADVVFVSELSSAEELDLALRLADDGALVLTTARANGVVSTVERLAGAFAPDVLPNVRARVADCLAGVVVQHLLRATDGKSLVAVHEVLV